jgi:uncharacterized protein YllA (UPF0747 family)
MAARAESLSPNALLRPVVQDFLLPTVTLIGGPAEVAYLAQTAVLYEALDRPMPIVTARSGFTLLDARTTKLMERYRLALPDVLTRADLLREKIAARLVPTGLQQSIAGTRESVSSALDKLLGEVGAFDPTLGAAAAKSRAKILHQLQKIEAKTARQALRLDARAQSEAAYLHAALYYEKHLQERFYTMLPFLARHGFELIGKLRESVRLECPDHVVLPV